MGLYKDCVVNKRFYIFIFVLFFSRTGFSETFVEITNGVSYLRTNILVQLSYALDERKLSGISTPFDLSSGTEVNIRATSSFVDFVEESRNFVRTEYKQLGSTGGGWVLSPSTNLASFLDTDIGTTNYLDFLVGCGLSTNGWRKAYSWTETNDWTDPLDPMFSFNTNDTMSLGEIVGPWIVVDIQTVFDAMEYKYESLSGDWYPENDISYPPFIRFGGGQSLGETNVFGDAVSLAQSDFGEKSSSLVDEPREWSFASYDGSAYDVTFQAIPHKWDTEIGTNDIRSINGSTFWFAAMGVSPSNGIDIGVVYTNNAFDANASSLVENKYVIFSTNTYSSGATSMLSSAIGSTNLPSTMAEPTISTNTSRGWKIDSVRAFIKYNFDYTR